MHEREYIKHICISHNLLHIHIFSYQNQMHFKDLILLCSPGGKFSASVLVVPDESELEHNG